MMHLIRTSKLVTDNAAASFNNVTAKNEDAPVANGESNGETAKTA